MEKQQIVNDIKTLLPDAEVIPEGQDCNFTVSVVSETFTGMRTVARQQLVLGAFTQYLRSGELHALSVKAYTRDEWKIQLQNQQSSLVQL